MFKLRIKHRNKYFDIKNHFKKFPLILMIFPLVILSCATTNKGKILETIVLGAAIGASYGTSKPNFKNENALMYGALGGLTGSLIGLYTFDEERRSEELKQKVLKLEAELDSFGKSPNTDSTALGNATSQPTTRVQLQSFLPKKLQKLVKPGEWALYRIDEWEQLDDSKMVHKDQVLEFKPPELLVPLNN
jgi:hypothetical protein